MSSPLMSTTTSRLSTNVGNDMDVATSVAGDGQIDVQEELEEIISASLCISGESLVKTVKIGLP